MTNTPLTSYSLMDRLRGIFSPIHAKWEEWKPEDLYLWEENQNRSTLIILEQDMRSIGHFFANADNIGARSEYVLTAECIAQLRMFASTVSNTKMMEQEIEKIERELQSRYQTESAPIASQSDHIEPPIAWRMAQHVTAAGRYSPAALEGLLEVYIDIAHMFILCDGNITPDEDNRLKRYHAAFSR